MTEASRLYRKEKEVRLAGVMVGSRIDYEQRCVCGLRAESITPGWGTSIGTV